MSDIKMQTGVYKIDEECLENMCDIVKSKGYKNQSLENTKIDGYKLSLFYKKKFSVPKWKHFLCQIAADDQPILKERQSMSESFVLFLFNEQSKNLFVLAGGAGYFAIQDYINNDFGIDIVSRIINKEDKILKATREKSLVGGVLGTTMHFRSNFNLFETDGFGKIYQELKARLDKETLLSKLGFARDDIKKESVCIAKSSFKINKAITLRQLLTMITGCEAILESEKPILINKVEKIEKKKNASLVQNLQNALLNQLWDRYRRKDRSYLFDLCHKYYDEYLTASQFVVKKGLSTKNFFKEHMFDSLVDIDGLFDRLKRAEKKPNDKDEFVKLINALKIYSFDEEGKELTKDSLVAHLLGDVTIDGQKYFFIDKAWYRIKNEFMNELNSFCKAFIERNYINELFKSWDYPNEKENQYNQRYIGEEHTIVLDKVTSENIEPCDILKWDTNNLYLFHVKAGFGNTMRDLCSQIVISAARIIQDLTSSKEYIKKIYASLSNKIGGEHYFDAVGKQSEHYSKDDFVSLFDKNLVFVLAVLDTATDRIRDIKNIELFQSNIAKFSLQELVKEMNGIGANLKIAQISKPE